VRQTICETEPVIRLKVCASPECRAVFTICISCDRGQRYCSAACRDAVRRQARREADRRYQGSERGRQAHHCRQRRYRQRQATARVTDQACRPFTAASAPTRPQLCYYSSGLTPPSTIFGVPHRLLLQLRLPIDHRLQRYARRVPDGHQKPLAVGAHIIQVGAR